MHRNLWQICIGLNFFQNPVMSGYVIMTSSSWVCRKIIIISKTVQYYYQNDPRHFLILFPVVSGHCDDVIDHWWRHKSFFQKFYFRVYFIKLAVFHCFNHGIVIELSFMPRSKNNIISSSKKIQLEKNVFVTFSPFFNNNDLDELF